MFEYFDEKGELRVSHDRLWDEDGDLRHEVYLELKQKFTKLPSDSTAVKLYYADLYSAQTSGNYCAETLYNRTT